MATKVSDIIVQAFLDIGAIAAGETPNADEQADAFLRLNQLIGSWSNEELFVFNQVNQQVPLSFATSVYTLGPAGASWVTIGGKRAMRITAWRATSGHVIRGGAPLSLDVFSATAAAEQARLAEVNTQALLAGQIVSYPVSISSPVPSVLGADTAYPYINVRIFPPPTLAPGTLEIEYFSPLSQFATVNDTINMPDGFEDALHFNLAVAIYPQYPRQGGIDPALVQNAGRSKGVIIDVNRAARSSGQPQQQPQPQQAA